MAQKVKNLPVMQELWVQSLGLEGLALETIDESWRGCTKRALGPNIGGLNPGPTHQLGDSGKVVDHLYFIQ